MNYFAGIPHELEDLEKHVSCTEEEIQRMAKRWDDAPGRIVQEINRWKDEGALVLGLISRGLQ